MHAAWFATVAKAGLTGRVGIGYDRRLSICSGKDNKVESAPVETDKQAEPPFEHLHLDIGSQHENFFR
jgi:hypothetical protein